MGRYRAIAALTLTLALTAAACGDDDERVPTDQSSVVEQSSAVTEVDSGEDVQSDAQASASDEPDGSGAATSSEDDPPAVTTAAAGVGDGDGQADTDALMAAMDAGLAGGSFRGAARFDAPTEAGAPDDLESTFESDADGDLAVRVEIPAGIDPTFPGGADAEVRYVDGVTYVRPPLTAEASADTGIEGGEAWYIPADDGSDDSVGFAEMVGPAGGLMCLFPQALAMAVSGCDPMSELAALIGAASEAEIVGHEELRGAETMTVRLMVPFSALDPAAADGLDGDAEAVADLFGLADGGLTVDVWIDNDNRLRQFSFDLFSMFGGIAEEATDMPSLALVFEFYDFDADISVDAPPPEAIVDDPSLLGIGDDDFAETTSSSS